MRDLRAKTLVGGANFAAVAPMFGVEAVAIVARIAAAQHGRVTTRQLREAGVDKRRTHRWLVEGRIHRVHREVYAVGHAAPTVEATYMAAVLAGGDGARLSHGPAAHLMGLVRGTVPPPPEVTVATESHRRQPGIVIHRVRELPKPDWWVLHGIPLTTVPRTLLDLAPRMTVPQLARACHEAWVRYRVTLRDFERCIARNPTKKGVAKLRAALGVDVTLSKLEVGFVALLREHGLPVPRTNIDLRGDKVDCHWPQLGVTVELLSFRYHATRAAFETDVARRRRSNHVAYTYGDVFERGAETIADLAARLRSS